MFRLSYFILRGHVTTVDALMAMYNADSRVLQDTVQWESKRFSMAKQSTYDWYVMSFTVYNSYTYPISGIMMLLLVTVHTLVVVWQVKIYPL